VAIAILASLLIVGAAALAVVSLEPPRPGQTDAVGSPKSTPSALGTSPAASSGATLPIARLTPGVVSADVGPDNLKSTICVVGYTSGRRHDDGRTVRPPESYTNALKRQQIAEYGYVDTKLGDYEEDHLIPLEVGGDGYAPGNLWPEPYSGTGARVKDQIENRLHQLVCSGQLGLRAAQQAIAQNWFAAYLHYVLGQS
jgi:hypothetical protein